MAGSDSCGELERCGGVVDVRFRRTHWNKVPIVFRAYFHSSATSFTG